MKQCLIWLCLGCLLVLPVGCQKDSGAKTEANPNPAHPSMITQAEMKAVLASPPGGSTAREGRIISGVVPHHLVAGRLIADFFASLAFQQPGLVILIGPNHNNLGGKVITGEYDWQTPAGTVTTEPKVVKALLNKELAVKDEEILAGEHSIGALVPFIRHFLPQARVVPIILHHDVTLAEVDALLKGLNSYLDEDTVLVSSVDFSHYLTRREARAKDAATLNHMKNFDYITLFHLGNDHLDSPASLACAFRLAQGRGITEFQVLENTNSGIIMENDVMQTTSYFTLVFTAQ